MSHSDILSLFLKYASFIPKVLYILHIIFLLVKAKKSNQLMMNYHCYKRKENSFKINARLLNKLMKK